MHCCRAAVQDSMLQPARTLPQPYLAVRAFSMVSAVVKVLLTMTTSVVSGSRPPSAVTESTGSTLARNSRRRPKAACGGGVPSNRQVS